MRTTPTHTDLVMLPAKHVWIFNGSGSRRFPGGVFSTLEKAEQWIVKNRLTGVLTAYPLDEGCLDWAVAHNCTGLSKDKWPSKLSDPEFIGSFSTASQEHFHYEAGHRQ